MIPPELFQRVAELKERAETHEDAAVIERAEARGMETVLEVWQAQAGPVPIAATLEPRGRRDIRAMVLEEVRARRGVAAEEVRDRIGRVELSQVKKALTYWADKEALMRADDGRWFPHHESFPGSFELVEQKKETASG